MVAVVVLGVGLAKHALKKKRICKNGLEKE